MNSLKYCNKYYNYDCHPTINCKKKVIHISSIINMLTKYSNDSAAITKYILNGSP